MAFPHRRSFAFTNRTLGHTAVRCALGVLIISVILASPMEAQGSASAMLRVSATVVPSSVNTHFSFTLSPDTTASAQLPSPPEVSSSSRSNPSLTVLRHWMITRRGVPLTAVRGDVIIPDRLARVRVVSVSVSGARQVISLEVAFVAN